MAKNVEVWRKIDGLAVRCTECVMNRGRILAGENPVGVDYTCEAEGGVCIFLHKPLDNDKWYSDFKDIYKEARESQEVAE